MLIQTLTYTSRNIQDDLLKPRHKFSSYLNQSYFVSTQEIYADWISSHFCFRNLAGHNDSRENYVCNKSRDFRLKKFFLITPEIYLGFQNKLVFSCFAMYLWWSRCRHEWGMLSSPGDALAVILVQVSGGRARQLLSPRAFCSLYSEKFRSSLRPPPWSSECWLLRLSELLSLLSAVLFTVVQELVQLFPRPGSADALLHETAGSLQAGLCLVHRDISLSVLKTHSWSVLNNNPCEMKWLGVSRQYLLEIT